MEGQCRAFRLRAAMLDDIEAMHRIRLAARENALADPRSVTQESYARLLESDGKGWVAEHRGQLVGFAMVDLAEANVWALFIDSPFQSLGIGKSLHEGMIASCARAGLSRLWLTTEKGSRAETFYIRLGWCDIGEKGAEERVLVKSLRAPPHHSVGTGRQRGPRRRFPAKKLLKR